MMYSVTLYLDFTEVSSVLWFPYIVALQVKYICHFIDARRARAKDINGENKNVQISQDRTDYHPNLTIREAEREIHLRP